MIPSIPQWGKGGPAAVSEPEVEEPFSEIESVHTWVEFQLLDRGFSMGQAAALVLAGADWHQATKLLDQDCSHERVVEILT